MPTKPRYLTKSRFKQAIECPTKLFYTGKKDEYVDNSLSDDFLIALAKGGYQVGELAKHYFQGGHDIRTLDYEEALNQTNELLKRESVIIYEAAIRYRNLFIRVDVLVKQGSLVKLIEVKAKSYFSSDEFLTGKGEIPANWKKYHYDVAFQKYVLCGAHPEFKVEGYLMLANKNVKASVDGLYQKFLIREDQNGRLTVEARDTDNLGDPILSYENIDHIIEKIWNGKEQLGDEELDFKDYVSRLADAYENDEKIEVGVTKNCRDCQYKLKNAAEDGLKSGFHECWTSMTDLTPEDIDKPLVIDIWDCRIADKYIRDGILLQKDVDPETLGKINPNHNKSGYQRVERQELQVMKSKNEDNSFEILVDDLKAEMEQVVYPLHMIDFETTMTAIPYNIGRHPYEQIAFQFSHHMIEKDGTTRHASEWLNQIPGAFPNFEFTRALKRSLEYDTGSVFRYSHHENTVLNKIHGQLKTSSEPDKNELMEFIEAITHNSEGSGRKKTMLWQGERNMIDLWDWVKRFYFDPKTNGSNSLKAILPSIIDRSNYLKEKYSQPIYGNEIFSHNFKDHTWISFEDDKLISPYKRLPKLWDKFDRDLVDYQINPKDELDDGGAAMTAYNFMQFPEMRDVERQATISALLHYCELDTMAMVMLWEGLEDLVRQ